MAAMAGPGKDALITEVDGWTFAMWRPGQGSPVLFAVAPETGEWSKSLELYPTTPGYDLEPSGWHSQGDYVFAIVDCRSGKGQEYSPIVRQVWADGTLGPCFADGDKPCHDLPFLLLMPCEQPCSAPCEAGCAGLVGAE